MSYTTGIPRSGQSLGNSRPQVQGNFDYINTAFAINHVAFNSSGVGKHKFLQMPEQSAAPATIANEGALYTKEKTSITNLFWRQESSGTEIQMTNLAPTNNQKGCTFLPGGILIQWDQITLIGGTANVTFQEQFLLNGVANDPWSIVLTLGNSPGTTTILGVSSSSVTSLGFTINSLLGANQLVYYMAIGPRT